MQTSTIMYAHGGAMDAMNLLQFASSDMGMVKFLKMMNGFFTIAYYSNPMAAATGLPPASISASCCYFLTKLFIL